MKKILNVGCGSDTYGTHFVDIMPQRPEVIKCDLNTDKLPFPDNFFDEVYAECVFEHLKNPGNFLRESNRVLKKGGKLVLITDNAGFHGLFGRVHMGGYEYYKTLKKDNNFLVNKDKHYALFTPHHIRNWLKEYGFRNIEVKYYIKNNKILKKHILLFKIISKLYPRFSPHIKAIAEK